MNVTNDAKMEKKKKQEDEFLLQQKIIGAKMEEKRIMKKKILSTPLVIFVATLIFLGGICVTVWFLKSPKEFKNDGGIAKSRIIRQKPHPTASSTSLTTSSKNPNTNLPEEFSSKYDCRPYFLKSFRSHKVGAQNVIAAINIQTANICPTKSYDEFSDNNDGAYAVLILEYRDKSIFINKYAQFQVKTIFAENAVTVLSLDIDNEISHDQIAFVLLELDDDLLDANKFKSLMATNKPVKFTEFEEVIKSSVLDIFVENVDYEKLFRENCIISAILDKLGLPRSCQDSNNNSKNPSLWKRLQRDRKCGPKT